MVAHLISFPDLEGGPARQLRERVDVVLVTAFCVTIATLLSENEVDVHRIDVAEVLHVDAPSESS